VGIALSSDKNLAEDAARFVSAARIEGEHNNCCLCTT
jgi:hypothetical protein